MKKNINIFNRLKENKQLLFTLCSILVLILLCGGVTFAIFSYNDSSDNNDINSGYISMSYVEPSNEYFVENALPMKDSQAMYLDNYFEFSVSTTVKTNEDDDNGVTIPYEITITESSGNTLTSDQIKMFVTEVEGEKEAVNLNPTLVSNLEPSIYKSEGIKVGFNLHLHRNGNETITTKYRLRAWIDYDVDASDWKTAGMYEYKFKVNVNGEANYQGFTTDQSCFAYEELGEVEGTYYYAITGYDYDRCGGNNVVVPTYIKDEKVTLYKEILDVGTVDLATATDIYKNYYFATNCSGYADLDACVTAKGFTVAILESQIADEYEFVAGELENYKAIVGKNYYDYKDEIDAALESDYAKLGMIYATLGEDKNIVENITGRVYQIKSFDNTQVVAVNNDKKLNNINDLNNVVNGEGNNISTIADEKPYINSLIIPTDITFETDDTFSSYRIGKLYDTLGNFPSICYRFSSTDGGANLNDFLCRGVENIVIPANSDREEGLPVVSVANVAAARLSSIGLKSVTMPDTVLHIGDSVFSKNDLEYVRLSNNLVSIGSLAFADNKLEKIELPDSITSIGGYAFQNNYLEQINVPNSLVTVGVDAFLGNKITGKLVFSDSVISIGNNAFSGNKIEEIEFLNSPATIGVSSFSGNNLKNIVIPSSIISVGNSAFANNKLNKVVLADNVSISDTTFSGNIINEIVNEQGRIPAACFGYTSDGTAITISNFKCSGLKNVSILSEINGLPVTIIGLQAFQSRGIENVVIPDSVTEIKNYAFNKNSLKEVIIPDSVITVGNYAFQYNKLSKVKLSNNLTSLGINAFRYNSLVDLIIPNGITELTTFVFANNNLKYVEIPDSVTTIGTYAFQNNSLTSLLLPNSVTSIANYAFDQNQLKSVIFSENLTKIGNYGFSNNQLVNVHFPNSLTTIGTYAFQNNKIEKIELPEGLTSIGNYSFNKNNLVNVVIPSTVKTIGQRAFYKDATSNSGLVKIINKPNKAFNWNYIVNGSSSTTFVSGTVTNDAGNVEIVLQ